MTNNFFAIISNSQPSDVSIKSNPDANGFDVKIKNVQAQFHSKNLTERLNIMNAKGSVLVDMSNITIDLTVSVKSQKVNGSLVPAFKSSNAEIRIPENNISLSVCSNVIAKVALKIKETFVETIKS